MNDFLFLCIQEGHTALSDWWPSMLWAKHEIDFTSCHINQKELYSEWLSYTPWPTVFTRSSLQIQWYRQVESKKIKSYHVKVNFKNRSDNVNIRKSRLQSKENHQDQRINNGITFAATWMDLEIIILSEISQTKKDKYNMI